MVHENYHRKRPTVSEPNDRAPTRPRTLTLAEIGPLPQPKKRSFLLV